MAIASLNSESWEARVVIANDPNTSPEILVQLSKDPDTQVRAGIAGNPNTPVEILEKIADRMTSKDYLSEPQVYLALAANPSLPESTIRHLFKFRNNLTLQCAIARNPSTPMDIIEQFMNKTSDDTLQRSLLRNPSISRSMYNKIYKNIVTAVLTYFDVIVVCDEHNDVDKALSLMESVLRKLHITLIRSDIAIGEDDRVMYEEIYAYLGDDIHIEGISLACKFIPEDDICEDIIANIEATLTENGYEIVELGYEVSRGSR